jgi:hypothetical protein
MKFLILAAAFAAGPALAQSSDCASVKQDKARLACYDKAAKDKPAAPTPSPAAAPVAAPVAATTPAAAEKPAKPGDKVVFKSQSWHVHQELDAMTDKKSCTALYKNEWKVQGTASALYLGYKGRGGVKYYTLRYDDLPAESLQSATSMEKDISAIIIDSSSSFDRIYNGKRLRAQVGTILGSLLVEDIDLAGFKESVDYIRANCGA